MLLLFLSLLAVSSSFDDALRVGLMSLQRGDLPAARTALESASRLSPRDGRVWVGLTQTYWKMHDVSEAEHSAVKAAEFSSDDSAVLEGLAIYYAESGQTLKAAAAESRYFARSPDRTSVGEHAAKLYFDAVKPLLDKQNFGEAASILKQTSARQLKSAQLELALGVACYGLRRFDDAADAFLRAIAIAPDTDQAYSFLANFLNQIPSRLPEATQRFTEYESAHPASPAGFLFHAKALDAQSLDPEAALKLLNRSIALDSRNASAHFERGTILDRLQRFSEAAASFEQAVQLDGSDADSHYRLARDYDRTGRPDAARAEREKHALLIKAQDASR